jgi:hypothetical protein
VSSKNMKEEKERVSAPSYHDVGSHTNYRNLCVTQPAGLVLGMKFIGSVKAHWSSSLS